MTIARTAGGDFRTGAVIQFPVARTRPSAMPRPAKKLSPSPSEVGIWLDEPSAIEVERRLEDYGRVVSRAWDVSAIAATIGAATGAEAQACADAARQVSEQILATTRVPLGEPI